MIRAMVRVHLLFVLVVAAHVLASSGCGASDPSDASAAAPAGAEDANLPLRVASVQLLPASVMPGDRFEIAIVAPEDAPAAVKVSWAGQEPVVGALTPSAGQRSGPTSGTAPDAFGDVLVTVTGSGPTTRVRGYALLQVVDGVPCPSGTVREGEDCLPQELGHRLELTHIYRPIPYGTDAFGTDLEIPPWSRTGMVHIRGAHWRGQHLLVCLEYFLAVLHEDDLLKKETIQGWTDRDVNVYATQPIPALQPLSEDGFQRCDSLLMAHGDSVIVTVDRGVTGGHGHMSSWTWNGRDLPEPVQTLHNLNGYGRTALGGDGRMHVVRLPAAVETYAVDAGGAMELQASADIPLSVAVRSLTADNERLYAGTVGHCNAVDSQDLTGCLVVLESDGGGGSPRPIGAVRTTEAPTDVVVLPDDVVATASGAAGIELFDVSNPERPRQIGGAPSSAPVLHLAATPPYLLATVWDGIRLYDASQKGVLRMLDTEDMRIIVDGNVSFAAAHIRGYLGSFGADFVALEGLRFLSNDFEALLLGTVRPGRDAARANLVDRKRVVTPRPDGEPVTVAVRVTNGGREVLEVNPRAAEGVEPASERQVVAPGETVSLEFRVAPTEVVALPESPTGGPQDPQRTPADPRPRVPSDGAAASEDPNADPHAGHDPLIHQPFGGANPFTLPSRTLPIQTNDPTQPVIYSYVRTVGEQLHPGDVVPPFKVPYFEACEGTDCFPSIQCLDTAEKGFRDRPILLAFFSSW